MAAACGTSSIYRLPSACCYKHSTRVHNEALIVCRLYVATAYCLCVAHIQADSLVLQQPSDQAVDLVLLIHSLLHQYYA